MASNSAIEWTDATWNPIRGCSRVSEGCRNCYAEGVAYRFSGPGQPYEGLLQVDSQGQRKRQWNGQVRFVEERLLDPLKWGPVLTGICGGEGAIREKKHRDGTVTVTRERSRRIFVNSMSDLFHEGVTDEQLDRIFAVMALCPQHTFQVLTKRPERMLAYMGTKPGGQSRPAHARAADVRVASEAIAMEAFGYPYVGIPWPLPNVWMGVSVENQKAANERLMYVHRLAADGWQTMTSFEPLLGSIKPHPAWLSLGPRTWAIVGGESGSAKDIRPMHPDWARSLRDQCTAANVPFFFKQWGEHLPFSNVRTNEQSTAYSRATMRGEQSYFGACVLPGPQGMKTGVSPGIRPEGFARIGKKAAGDLLDGVQWHQFPEVRS